MKKNILIFFICLFGFTKIYASNQIYETEFYNIEINDELILDAKDREIDKIKIKSINSLLDKILTIKSKKKLLKLINITNELDKLILNIIIENEFISEKKYQADIKINFDHKEIIFLLRKYKINYTDIDSPTFLLIASEKNELSLEGLSFNNSFYKNNDNKNYQLINLIFPDLSSNDRFILPYEKIINYNKDSFGRIANKYMINKIFIINIISKGKKILFKISLYDHVDKSILYFENVNFSDKKDYQNQLISYLNNWWKINNQINNSIINQLTCQLKYLDIEELILTNSIINSLSQIKKNTAIKIKYLNNYNVISFYGDVNNLITKLSYYNIKMTVNKSINKCYIFSIK